MKKDLTIEDFMKGKNDAESIRSKMLKNINKNPKKTKIAFVDHWTYTRLTDYSHGWVTNKAQGLISDRIFRYPSVLPKQAL